MLREPAVAGSFYEKDAPALKKHLARYITEKPNKIRAKAIVVPHAGYIYSGRVAGEVYSSIEIPDIIILLGPNHTGEGVPVSIMNTGEWRTPLGDVKINEPLANEILKNTKAAEKDTKAHAREHSLEVQLPFLQTLKKSFTFVPITFGEYDIKKLSDVASAIAAVLKGKDALIVASTDLTHYEDAGLAKEKDMLVLQAIEKLDAEGLVKEVADNDISMCGWMPTYVAIKAAKLLGAKEGKIIKYMNSGDVSGDYDQVVGYGGAVII
jgi:AmmeMemoRadiSam system protein B